MTPRARSAILRAMTQKHVQPVVKPPTEAPERRPDGKFKGRISARLRTAVQAMIWEGASRTLAAKRAGMSEHGLYQALRRPHVLALMKQEFEALHGGAAYRAYARQEQLAEHASSEDVKERANKWIAGCAGLAPVQKVQGVHHVTHAFEGIGFAAPVDVTPDSGAESSS